MTEPFKITKGPFKGKTVHIAPQDRVTRLSEYIDQVLEILDHPLALVTDESSVGDFIDFDYIEEERQQEIVKLSKKFGFEVTSDSLLVDIAEKLQGGQ